MDTRILNNKYVISSIVGTGGMAIVYKGMYIDSGETVAIKMLRPEYLDDQDFVKRFKKEASIVSNIYHANIVNTKDVGIENGSPYIVMEYVEGRTLKEYIQEKKTLDIEEAVGIAIQICEAMKYAHSKHLVHRDIKPQNVLLGNDGSVKVGDFGIAKMATSSTVTVSGSNVLGSVHYMSPEQARGGMVNRKTDIYALGIVLYEMLTGKVPFTGDSPVSVAIKHLQEEIVSPILINPDIPVALDEIIMKATSKKQDARYKSASEFIDDLILSLEFPKGGFVKVPKDKDMGGTKKMPAITPEMMKKFGAAVNDTNNGISNGAAPHNRKKTIISILKIIISLVVVTVVILTLIISIRALNRNSIEVRNVPELVGLSLDIAIDRTKQIGLEYEILYENSSEVLEGIVISQMPETNAVLDKGEKITITVSLGTPMGIVPKVKEHEFAKASKLIEDAGFAVGDVNQEISDLPKDYVIRQEPPEGTDMPLGEKVHIWISLEEEKNTIEMPDLSSMYIDDAIELIEALGIDGISIEVISINSGYDKDIVILQEPIPGTIIDEKTLIKISTSNGEGQVYTIDRKILLSIEKDNTKVVIVYIDNSVEQTIYERELSKGDHSVTLTLTSITPGEKEIVIYYNNTVHANDRVVFKVSE